MDINAVLDSEKVSDVVTVMTKAVNEQKKPRAIAKVRFSFDDLNNVLYGCEVGDTVEAVIFRAGKQYLVSLTVAEAKGS